MAKKHANSGIQNVQGNRDNRANQLNPNNDAYWKSRGYDKKPSDKNNASATKKNEN